MEALYSKLYNKYTNFKKEKESQFDKLNHEQEVKFLDYAAAADEMIQYLKSENDRLHGQVDELKSELASIRASSDEQNVQYEKLLTEEKHKNKELSDEISRLKKADRDELSLCTTHEEIGHGQENSNDTTGEENHGRSATQMRKKRKSIHVTEGATNVGVGPDGPEDQHVYGDKSNGASPSTNQNQPVCCQRNIYNSGADAAGTSSFSCVFQYLVEFVVGMKVSPVSQSNEVSILAHHQSSGYSFSLTWITNSHGEVELLYRVLSLGTFAKVAPEWMKETLMFSTSMCSVFFERVSRIIKT